MTYVGPRKGMPVSHADGIAPPARRKVVVRGGGAGRGGPAWWHYFVAVPALLEAPPPGASQPPRLAPCRRRLALARARTGLSKPPLARLRLPSLAHRPPAPAPPAAVRCLPRRGLHFLFPHRPATSILPTSRKLASVRTPPARRCGAYCASARPTAPLDRARPAYTWA